MEDGAQAERANPRQKYQDLPELNDSLKPLLATLLTDAATLERGYQAVLDAANGPSRSLLDELHQRHRNWLSERERFILALKKGGVPRSCWM